MVLFQKSKNSFPVSSMIMIQEGNFEIVHSIEWKVARSEICSKIDASKSLISIINRFIDGAAMHIKAVLHSLQYLLLIRNSIFGNS